MASPNIKFYNRDESPITITSSDTVLGLIGFASKGPIGEPTLCTSKRIFQDSFGLTPKAFPYAHMMAYRYFNQGNQLLFTRIAGTTAESTSSRTLTNNGTGTVAKITSTNTFSGGAALTTGTAYGIKITTMVSTVSYSDLLYVTLSSGTMTELVTMLNSAITASTELVGKVVVTKTLVTGLGSGDYLTFATVSAGMDDYIKIESPATGSSLVSNGTIGFSYTSQESYGNYTSASAASLTGVIAINSNLDLSTNKRLNLLVDGDSVPTTIDLTASNQAIGITNTAQALTTIGTTSAGFSPTKYNINVAIDGAVATTVDVTGNAGIGYSTPTGNSPSSYGYQSWPAASYKTTTSPSGLSRFAKCGFGGSTLTISGSAGLTGGTPYTFAMNAAAPISIGTYPGIAGADITFTPDAAHMNFDANDSLSILNKIKNAIDAAYSGVLAGKYSLVLDTVLGDLIFTITNPGWENVKTKILMSAAGTKLHSVATYWNAKGVTTSANPQELVPVYEMNYTLDGVGPTAITVNGSSAIDTIGGLLTAIRTALPGSGLTTIGINWIAGSSSAPVYDTDTGASGGTYGTYVLFSRTRNNTSAMVFGDGSAVAGTKQALFASNLITLGGFAPAAQSAVAGKDAVLLKTTILGNINAALYGKAIATYNSSNYLQVQTLTKGSLGSVQVAAGSTNDAGSFFGTAALIAGGKSTPAADIVTAINTQMNAARLTSSVIYASLNSSNQLVFNSVFTGTSSKIYLNSTTGLVVNAPSGDAYTTVYKNAVWSAVDATSIGSNGSMNGMFKFLFQEKGTGSTYVSSSGKGCKLVFSTRNNPIYGGSTDTANKAYYRDLEIYWNGNVVETFQDISFDVTDTTNWILTRINADPGNGGSAYITAEWYQPDTDDALLDVDTAWSPSNPTTGTYLIPDQTLYFTGGNDGIPNSGLEALYQAGISAYSNVDLYDPHMLATPGMNAISVINAAFNMISSPYRGDILYLVDPPFGLLPSGVASWHNGKSTLPLAPTTALNSEFGTMYWSWQKMYDEDNAEYVWLPPSAWAAEKFTELDNQYGAGSIPAGLTRGIITVEDYEYSPAQDERDLLYDVNGPLNVNPIVNEPGIGMVIEGQKTLYRSDSPRNRLNVERLLIATKKMVRRVLKRYLQEPNTPSTWGRLTNELNLIFEPYKQKGQLTAYQVLFDSTTTTASMQDQHKLGGLIKLQVPSSIELIEVTFSTAGSTVTFG